MSHIGKPPCDEGVIRGAAPCIAPATRAEERWILAATILGSSMAFVDGTAVNVALPVLQAEIDATAAEVQWVVESYALLLASLLLVAALLGDWMGCRRIFASGVALAVSSMGCGLVTTVSQLIAARAVQGVGAAFLVREVCDPGSVLMRRNAAAPSGPVIHGRHRRGGRLGDVRGEPLLWWVFYQSPIALVVPGLPGGFPRATPARKPTD
jgi:MFS family permease